MARASASSLAASARLRAARLREDLVTFFTGRGTMAPSSEIVLAIIMSCVCAVVSHQNLREEASMVGEIDSEAISPKKKHLFIYLPEPARTKELKTRNPNSFSHKIR